MEDFNRFSSELPEKYDKTRNRLFRLCEQYAEARGIKQKQLIRKEIRAVYEYLIQIMQEQERRELK